MKGAAILAGTAVLGTVNGLHRMKLEKIPLAEQLVRSLAAQGALMSLLTSNAGSC